MRHEYHEKGLRVLSEGYPGTRLVVLPHAGGSAGFYQPLAEAMGGMEVIAAQYPGRQDRIRENQFPSIHRLADAILGALAALPLAPTILLGHSMGSLVAFEMALGRPDLVDHLVVSAHRAPSVPSRSTLHLADDLTLMRETGLLGGTADEVLENHDLVKYVVPPLRVDLALDADYCCRPDVCVSAPITALRGLDDSTVTAADVTPWSRHSREAVSHYCVDGGHFYLLDHCEYVAELIWNIDIGMHAPTPEGIA